MTEQHRLLEQQLLQQQQRQQQVLQQQQQQRRQSTAMELTPGPSQPSPVAYSLEQSALPPPPEPGHSTLGEKLFLAEALLARGKAMRKETSQLKSTWCRTNDEQRQRVEASLQCLGVLNATDMNDPVAVANLLKVLAARSLAMEELRLILNKTDLFSADAVVKYKYLLKLKMRRMEPMLSAMRQDNPEVCSFSQAKEYYEKLDIPEV
jgi:hypothetical protein